MNSNKANVFIIGAPKCGTSALATYLEHHPTVFLANPKEPFYWSFDYPGLQARNGFDSLEKYEAMFEEASLVHTAFCEGSTNYLRSECALENIMGYNPDARFIVMLRNPVDVVHAFHSELLFSYNETEPDFRKAWQLQEKRARGEAIPDTCTAPQFLQYAQVARFAEQIERFFEIVPESQRKVIVFDDFAKDTKKVFDETLDFLGLSPFEMESFERVNAAHGHRFPLFSKLILDPPAPLKPLVNGLREVCREQDGWVRKIKMMLRKPEKRVPLTPELRAELSEFFADDVKQLSSLLGRDLSHWTETARSSAAATVFPAVAIPNVEVSQAQS